MHFKENHIYHIYNQGNNRQRIFFSEENYLFLLKKMRHYLLPFSDVLAWCLMPNHFHWMVYVKHVEAAIGVATVGVTQSHPDSSGVSPTDGVTQSHPDSSGASPTVGVPPRDPDSNSIKLRTFNESIGILLRSYTRAVNKQENRSGCLFREETKAVCLTEPDGITQAFFEITFGTQMRTPFPEEEYPQRCFEYIHNNPVKAKLCKSEKDWRFSSWNDYYGNRKGNLINRDRVKEFIEI